jgi:hypothetical protein
MLRGTLAYHTFSLLRKLAVNAGRIPDRHLIRENTDYTVAERIFACGGFADVRRGGLANGTVAVKTIRITQGMDVSKIRKVGAVMRVLFPGSAAHMNPQILGLLQGTSGPDGHSPP